MSKNRSSLNGVKKGNTPWNKNKSNKDPKEMIAAGYEYAGKWIKVSDKKLKKEKQEFVRAMKKAQGVVKTACGELGIKRSIFYKKIRR